MSESVHLPALGESVTEGTVTRWLKNVGDRVEVDEPLLEVSTDKVDTEIPSPISGVLEEILVQEDETVEVGAVLARVGDGSGSASPAPASTPDAAPTAVQATSSPEPVAVTSPETAAAEPAAPPVPAPAGTETDIVLPALGESVTEGTVTRWLKSVGDNVAVDEPLLEVSTDKVDTEVPSPVAGVLSEILVQEDQTVEVGAVLARVGGSLSDASVVAEPATVGAPEVLAAPAVTPAAPVEPAPVVAHTPKPVEPPVQTVAPASAPAAPATAPRADAYVTPIVRKLANQLGVPLESVVGSGVGGRIRKEDIYAHVERAAESASKSVASAPSAPAAPASVSALRGTTQPMSRLRRVIAERAVASMHATAQLTTVVEVDVTAIAELRARVQAQFIEKTGGKLSFMPFFAVAATEALQSFPIINASVDGDSIVYPAVENISIAVDTERGLLTPVVKNAGGLTIAQFSAQIAELAARTRENKLTPDELSGGTFTLTNTGSRGALFDTPLVFTPQVAILGTGAVVKKPIVVSSEHGEALAIRSVVYLALSYDHRIVDGADAARFLTQVKNRLEEGAFEANLGI